VISYILFSFSYSSFGNRFTLVIRSVICRASVDVQRAGRDAVAKAVHLRLTPGADYPQAQWVATFSYQISRLFSAKSAEIVFIYE